MSVRSALVCALGLVACKEPARDPAGRGSAAPPPVVVPDARATPDQLGVGPALATVDAPPAIDAAPLPPFADEERDDAWARETERVLRRDLAALPHVTDVTVECRFVRCRLSVTARDAGAMVDASAELERALAGHAVHVMYGNPAPGGATVEVFAVFER